MRVVILDRDGVINEDSDAYIKSVSEWLPIPGSLESIARLNYHGYRVLVASNQSGLARGVFSIDDLNAIHAKMHRDLARLGGQIEAIFFCPHSPEDACRCRKPQPGLFEQIAQRFRIDFRGTPIIGDSIRDIQVARSLGASPALVLTGKGQSTWDQHALELHGVPVFANLSAAVGALVHD